MSLFEKKRYALLLGLGLMGGVACGAILASHLGIVLGATGGMGIMFSLFWPARALDASNNASDGLTPSVASQAETSAGTRFLRRIRLVLAAFLQSAENATNEKRADQMRSEDDVPSPSTQSPSAENAFDSLIPSARSQKGLSTGERFLRYIRIVLLPAGARFLQSTKNRTSRAGNAFYEEVGRMKTRVQTSVVVYLPRRWFARLAQWLPIGGWIVHEKTTLGWNVLRKAAFHEEVATVAAILDIPMPKEIYYRFLRGPGWQPGSSLLEDVIRSGTETSRKILILLLSKISPDERLSLLDFRCVLAAADNKEALAVILSALPGSDRYAFLAQPHPYWGNRPIVAMLCPFSIMQVLQACPPERLFEYLTHKNSLGRTPLMEFLHLQSGNTNERVPLEAQWWVETLISRIPEAQRRAFLACHDQGKKAMWLAQANAYLDVVTALEKWGISRIAVSLRELQSLPPLWHALSFGQRIIVESAMCRGWERRQIPVPQIIIDANNLSVPWESLPQEVKKRALLDIKKLVARWERLSLEERGRELSVFEDWPHLIPQGLVGPKHFQETLQRWWIMEQLERKGITFSETMDLQTLENRLPPEMDKEAISPHIADFQALFGEPPAVGLRVPKGQEENFLVIKQCYRRAALDRHPDKNVDPDATQKTQILINAYQLHKEHLNQTEKELKQKLQKNWRQTFGKPRRKSHDGKAFSTIFKEG